MKITPNVIKVLRNFSTINPNLYVEANKPLRTINQGKSVLAFATDGVSTFSETFGIYDLNEFLSILGLIQEPELKFDANSVKITDGRAAIKYRFADKNILTYPTKDVVFLDDAEKDASFKMPADTLAALTRAASVLSGTNIRISSKKGSTEVTAVVYNSKNPAGDEFSVILKDDELADKEYEFVFLMSNFLFIPGDYIVKISPKGISFWQGELASYFVATEK